MTEILDWKIQTVGEETKPKSDEKRDHENKVYVGRERILSGDGFAVVELFEDMTKEKAEKRLNKILEDGIKCYGENFLFNDACLEKRIKLINKVFPQARMLAMSICSFKEFVFDKYTSKDTLGNETTERTLVDKKVTRKPSVAKAGIEKS